MTGVKTTREGQASARNSRAAGPDGSVTADGSVRSERRAHLVVLAGRAFRAEGLPRHDRARDRGRGRDPVRQPVPPLRLQGVDRRRDPVELHQRGARRLPRRRRLGREPARRDRADRALDQPHPRPAPGRPRDAAERLELLRRPAPVRLPAQGPARDRANLGRPAGGGQGIRAVPRRTWTPSSPTGCCGTSCGSPSSGAAPAATAPIRWWTRSCGSCSTGSPTGLDPLGPFGAGARLAHAHQGRPVHPAAGEPD